MSLGTQTAPFTRQTGGTLAGDGDTVILYSPNSASATVTVEGTFLGDISLTGSILNNGEVEGGRLLFESGVGSIGSNVVVGRGNEIAREYRILCGGDYIIARASNWESGSASVRIHAQEAPNIVFINGPVHSTFEEAQRAGRSYSVGTGVQSVTTSNFLQYRFFNNTNNLRRCFVTDRIFTNNRPSGSVNLELGFFPEYATALAGATDVTPNNLKPGGAAAAAEFQWRVNGTSLGTPALGQILPLEGVSFDIQINRILEPGDSFAYQIGGAGGSLNNAARISASVIWFEETWQ